MINLGYVALTPGPGLCTSPFIDDTAYYESGLEVVGVDSLVRSLNNVLQM